MREEEVDALVRYRLEQAHAALADAKRAILGSS